MYIREVKKKNKGYKKEFLYHRLTESVRTPKGPRQRPLLNLGKLEIPKDEWKALANRIEEIVTGQESFLKPPQHIEYLAQHYAKMLIEKEMKSVPSPDIQAATASVEPDWETVDLNSLSQQQSRTVGAEALGYYAFKKLGFPQLLRKLGFSAEKISQAALLIVGRLVFPGSERMTCWRAKNASAIDELLGTDFSHLSNNALYRALDLLMTHHDTIETELSRTARNIFDLEERIILYDLTNTYMEGSSAGSEKAKRGRSKEKRNDCPLLTLAMVLDEDGFPKMSRVYPGNVSEPKTLVKILKELNPSRNKQLSMLNDSPTVVIDAGIGTEDNLKAIRGEGYHYISVCRSRPKFELPEDFVDIKTSSGMGIKAKKLESDDEVYLYCESEGRKAKEGAMKARFVKGYEEGLRSLQTSIKKPKGKKKYEKIIERLGRLKEKYPTIAQYYTVKVDKYGGNASDIHWEVNKEESLESRFSGTYYLRTSRKKLNEEKLWRLYMMLLEAEDAFRSIKSELGIRPNHHQKDFRMEGHIFISVLAYHLVALLQRELKQKGINHRWSTIRTFMSTQTRITSTMINKEGEKIYIRQTMDPEPFHQEVYNALGISPKSPGTKKFKR